MTAPAQRKLIDKALQAAVSLHQQRDFAKAEQLYVGILQIAPGSFDALHLLGVLRQQQGRDSEGLALIEKALALEPHAIRALANRAAILAGMGRHREALEAYEQIVTRDPNHAVSQWNRALLLLTSGNFRDGWPAYEWRAKQPEQLARQRHFDAPVWRGDVPLAGKTILLHAEQGYGDAVQFLRYAPLIATQGARVIVEADAALEGLFSRAAGVDVFITSGSALPPFDLHCPLLSLPLAFGTDADTIPAAVPYLTADSQRIEAWRARLPPRANATQRRIGFAWAGNRGHHNDRNRSVALAQFVPLFGDARHQFVSIQRDVSAEENALLSAHGIASAGSAFADFDDTAAVLSLLDLVIVVDTAVAHLAGALARPTWILLPVNPDWRWMLERDDSPWYPRARLWRQSVPGDWAGVFAKVRAELATAS